MPEPNGAYQGCWYTSDATAVTEFEVTAVGLITRTWTVEGGKVMKSTLYDDGNPPMVDEITEIRSQGRIFSLFSKFFPFFLLFWRVQTQEGLAMKKSILILGAVLAILTGCAKTMQLNDPALYDQYLTRTYNQPHDACYNAVIRTFAGRGVELTKADPMAGRIVTERHIAMLYAGYGTIGAVSHRYYIDVTGDKNRCTIKVTKYKAWKGDNEVPYVDVDQLYNYYWAPLFGGFESNFEEDEDDAVRSSKSLDAVMNQHYEELDEIYKQYMKDNKRRFEGRVALKFTIAASGKIIDISIESTTTGEFEFDQQIKLAVSTWDFGEIPGSNNKTIIVPFGFKDDEKQASASNGSGGIGDGHAAAQEGEVKVKGPRSAADIMKVVEHRTPSLRNIYNKYREKNPAFEGRVVLKFTIGPDGKVVSMSIKSSTTNNAKFDEEIKKKVSEWNFGKADTGNTTVTIPFVFSE